MVILVGYDVKCLHCMLREKELRSLVRCSYIIIDDYYIFSLWQITARILISSFHVMHNDSRLRPHIFFLCAELINKCQISFGYGTYT
jgi:hypothetical protein